MRGHVNPQAMLFSYVSPEARVPATHPLRRIKAIADQVLRDLSPTFAAMYSVGGRPSIPPERLLKSELLIVPYSVRSRRLFCERLDCDLSPASTTAPSVRRASGCWRMRWRSGSSTPSWRMPGGRACCPMNTSPWTAPQ